MILDSYLYGLVIGTTMCSFCTVPLIYFSAKAYMGNYKAILYLFLTRTIMVLIAIPLIFIGNIITLFASVAMIVVGTYGFMHSLESGIVACKSHTASLGGLICISEGFPAVLSSTVFYIAILNAVMFSLGSITPLFVFVRFKKRFNPKIQLIFSALLIIFAFYLFYKSLALLLLSYHVI